MGTLCKYFLSIAWVVIPKKIRPKILLQMYIYNEITIMFIIHNINPDFPRVKVSAVLL
jgi:hypothetical protein